MYKYAAIVLEIIDGDTYKMSIDARGFEMDGTRKVRLDRINCPETSKAKTLEERERGLQAKAFASELLLGKTVIVQPTLRQEKALDDFGRWLAEVYILQDDQEINVNDYLVEMGHAVYKNY